MTHLKVYTKLDILNICKIRKFETRLGERIMCTRDTSNWEQEVADTEARFVIIGIPEDIGVRANHGMAGAASAWEPFLASFLNLQSNDFLGGEDIYLLGHFDFDEIRYLIETNARNPEEAIEAYRHAVITIDDEVETIIKVIASAGKVPIVIGGGHNNSYPIIRGAAKGLHTANRIPLAQINCINLDSHTDYRPSEGRHSGNGFRYAEEDGFLQKYCVVGVKENYLQQNVWNDFVNNVFLDLITYEDIFIHEKRNFIQAVAHATGFTEDNYTGIELDLDCIEDALCSADTPSGISVLNARQYIHFTATDTKAAYLHICEGAEQLADGRRDENTGKLISYLVTDFVKAYPSEREF